jgi:hypothetical protein
MPLHHAVLSLLADKPAHGYELRNSFEQAVGDQWGGLNIGHLYQILERLSRDEYAAHYNRHRPHRARSLRPPDGDDTALTPVTDLATARIRRREVLGGLIREYERAA